MTPTTGSPRCEVGRAWALGASRLPQSARVVVGLTVMVGLVGALVLGTVAGARRTGSALDRFTEASRAADLQLTTDDPSPAQLEAFRRVPGVAAVAVLPGFLIVPNGLSIVNVPGVDRTGPARRASRGVRARRARDGE